MRPQKRASKDTTLLSNGTTLRAATFHYISKQLDFAIQPIPTTAPLQKVEKYVYVAMDLAKALGASKMVSNDTAVIPTAIHQCTISMHLSKNVGKF